MLLGSQPYPTAESAANAPLARSSLAFASWFDLGSLPHDGPTITLRELLSAMLASPESADVVLAQIDANPQGRWIDLELPPRDADAGVTLRIGTFHRLVPTSPQEQVLLAWYGRRLPQVEEEAGRVRVELEQARRALAQQEAALRSERNRVESLLEAGTDPTSIQDTGYRIVSQNQAHRALFGDRRGEICHQVYRGRPEPCAGCPMDEALASGETAWLEDHPSEGPCAGSPVRIRVRPLIAPDSSPAGIVEVFSTPGTAAVERNVEVLTPGMRLRDRELQHILGVLELSGGNRAQAARVLGISRATLWRRLGSLQGQREDSEE